MSTTTPEPEVELVDTSAAALEAHVAEYLDDTVLIGPVMRTVASAAIESGWHAGRADLAERIREIHDEAEHRVKVLHVHYDILGTLDALARELEDKAVGA